MRVVGRVIILRSGGNQRELARAKNLKKQQAASKTQKGDAKDGNKGANLVKRQERYEYLIRPSSVSEILIYCVFANLLKEISRQHDVKRENN